MLAKRSIRLISSKTLLNLSIASLLAGACSSSFASGFQIFEGNVTNIANFGAGGAAGPLDASISAYNPAGLVHIKNQQLVVSSVGIFFDAKFHGRSIWDDGAGDTYTETGTAQGGNANFVPGFHYAAPITDRFVVGLSVITPFGLETDYGETSIVRYSATDTRFRTIDISPAFGAAINDCFSLGAGLDVQYADVRFNSILGAPTVVLPPGAPNSFFDTQLINEGSDWSFGWHAGILITPNKKTRIGVHYRSMVKHRLSGHSKITNGALVPVLAPTNTNLTAAFELPATTTVSVFHQFTDCFAMMASVNYTQWNVFRSITLINPAGPLPSISVPQNYHNTWRAAVGADVKVSKQWLIRMGVGFDETPTNNVDRDVRLPDGNRYAISFGTRYQATDHVALEFGYTHLFMKQAPINHVLNLPPEFITTIGHVRSSADLMGLQVTWDIV